MILYINGDSHAAAAEAVNPHAFAEDDQQYGYMGRVPHPDNLAVSWSRVLADGLKMPLTNKSESASSNHRIIRTTKEWIKENTQQLSETLMIIQWSTWEREEWLYDGVYYQVNGSGIDQVPAEAAERYRNYVIGLNWSQKTSEAHSDILKFHYELKDLGVKHIFFNGNNSFEKFPTQFDWGNSYIGPYDPKSTFSEKLTSAGYETVSPTSWHFGKDAHSFWAKFMLQYIVANKII
jgi:hypothetical protein